MRSFWSTSNDSKSVIAEQWVATDCHCDAPRDENRLAIPHPGL
jgi:hypothetical protein